MPQEPSYSQQIYDYLGTLDNTYQKDVSFDKFESSMQDRNFAQETYDWINSADNTFGKDVPFEKFYSSLKKKDLSLQERLRPSANGSQTISASTKEVAEIPFQEREGTFKEKLQPTKKQSEWWEITPKPVTEDEKPFDLTTGIQNAQRINAKNIIESSVRKKLEPTTPPELLDQQVREYIDENTGEKAEEKLKNSRTPKFVEISQTEMGFGEDLIGNYKKTMTPDVFNTLTQRVIIDKPYLKQAELDEYPSEIIALNGFDRNSLSEPVTRKLLQLLQDNPVYKKDILRAMSRKGDDYKSFTLSAKDQEKYLRLATVASPSTQKAQENLRNIENSPIYKEQLKPFFEAKTQLDKDAALFNAKYPNLKDVEQRFAKNPNDQTAALFLRDVYENPEYQSLLQRQQELNAVESGLSSDIDNYISNAKTVYEAQNQYQKATNNSKAISQARIDADVKEISDRVEGVIPNMMKKFSNATIDLVKGIETAIPELYKGASEAVLGAEGSREDPLYRGADLISDYLAEGVDTWKMGDKPTGGFMNEDGSFNGENLLYSIAEAAPLFLTLAAGNQLAAPKIMQTLGVGQRAANTIATVGGMYVTTYAQNADIADQMGITGRAKTLYAQSMTLNEALWESILPNNKVFGRSLKKQLIEEFSKELVEKGEKYAVKSLLKKSGMVIGRMGLDGGLEGIEEIGVNYTQPLINEAVNNVKDMGQNLNTDMPTLAQNVNAFAPAFFMSSIPSGVSSAASLNLSQSQLAEMAAQDIEGTLKMLEKSGLSVEDKKNIAVILETYNVLGKQMPDASQGKRAYAIPRITRIEELQAQATTEGRNPTLVKADENEISKLQKEVEDALAMSDEEFKSIYDKEMAASIEKEYGAPDEVEDVVDSKESTVKEEKVSETIETPTGEATLSEEQKAEKSKETPANTDEVIEDKIKPNNEDTNTKTVQETTQVEKPTTQQPEQVVEASSENVSEQPTTVDKPVSAKNAPTEKPNIIRPNKSIILEEPIVSKEKEKISIRIDGGEEIVSGQKVTIPYYEALELFAVKDGKQYIIYEKNTGMSLAANDTVQKAANNVYQTLLYQQAFNDNGYLSIYQIINDNIDKNGGTVNNGKKYTETPIVIPITEDKIKILERTIKETQSKISEEEARAKNYMAQPNTEFLEQYVKETKEKIERLKKPTAPTEKPAITPEETETLNKEAEKLGYENIFKATNSINKRLGTDYKDYRDIPKEDLQKVSEQRKAEKTPVVEAKAKSKKGKTYSKTVQNFEPQDITDHIAEFFLKGRASIDSYKSNGDSVDIEPSKYIKFLKKEGQPIDQIAQDLKFLPQFENIDEKEIIEAIVDFIKNEPSPEGYIQRKADEKEIAEIYEQIKPEVEAIDQTTTANEERINKFLEKFDYLDELGNIDAEKVLQNLDEFNNDPTYFGNILDLNENEREQLRQIAEERKSSDATGETAKISKSTSSEEPTKESEGQLDLKAKTFSQSKPEFIDKNSSEFKSKEEAGKFWEDSRNKGSDTFYSENPQYFVLGATSNIKGQINIDPIYNQTPKKLNEIVLDLTKNFEKDVLYTKTKSKGRRYLGYYKPSNAALVIKHINDLNTTAHEIGHALDDRYGFLEKLLSKEGSPIKEELLQLSKTGSKPPKDLQDKKQYKLGEGVAEWIRAFIINPDETINKYPEIYNWYKETVPEKGQKAIDVFSNDVRVFAGSTAINKIQANIVFDPEKKKGSIVEFFKPSAASQEGFNLNWGDRLSVKWIDRTQAIKTATDYATNINGTELLPKNNPVLLARLVLGINEKMDNIFENGMVDANLKRIVDKKTGKNLNIEFLIENFDSSSLESIKEEQQFTASVMVAQRVKELYNRFEKENSEAKEKGLPIPHSNIDRIINAGGGLFKNMDVVNEALNEFEQLKTDNPEKAKRIEESARRLRVFADASLQYLKDNGRISEDFYEQIKANGMEYVGLGRVMEANPNERVTGFKNNNGGALGTVASFEKVSGSERMLKDPYSFLIETVYKSVKEGDRNKVALSFVNMLESTRQMYEGEPNALATVGRPSKKGEPNTIEVFRNGEPEYWQLNPDIYDAFKNLNSLAGKIPAVFTFLPSIMRWTVTNSPVFALRNRARDLQQKAILNKDGFRFSDWLNKKEYKDRYALFGGGQAGYHLLNEDFYYRTLKEKMEELAKDKNTLLLAPKKIGQAYSNLLANSERATRLEQYTATYRKAKKKGLDDYDANLVAAYESRDLMDFAVAGTWMQYINQIIPFSNAAVRGTEKAIRTAYKDPVGFSVRMMLYSVIPSVLTLLIAKEMGGDEDDDWYSQLPAWRRDLFYNIKTGDNLVIAIPKPFELGVVGSGAERVIDRTVYKNEKAFEGYGGSVATSLFPFDESAIAGPYGTLVEMAANYDFFRKKNIIPSYEANKKLSLREGDKYASNLGKVIQNATGVDARKVDFLIKDMFTYYGDWATKASNIGDSTKRSFDLPTTGFLRNDAVSQNLDVKWVENAAESYGITQKLPYRLTTSRDLAVLHARLRSDFFALKDAEKKYYKIKTDEEKDLAAKELRKLATLLRKSWEKDVKELEKLQVAVLKAQE